MSCNYYTFSGYVNAYSIKKGCNKLSIKIKNIGKPSGFMKKYNIEPQPNDYLLFTDEDNLKKYHSSKVFLFQPKEFDSRLIDDKVFFAQKLTEYNKQPIPYSKDFKKLEYPIFFKSRYSYKDGIKYPRGFVCYSEEELIIAKRNLKEKGLNEDAFFYQKYIVGNIENNISTCGYFDYKNNHLNNILSTAKLLGTDIQKTSSTGSVICTIQDNWNLIQETTSLLNSLNYKGPFELEFIIDNNENMYIVELNPRFWMQHGVFISAYNNILLKRYFGDSSPFETIFKKIMWIDGLRITKAILSLEKGYLKKVFILYKTKKKEGYKAVFYPSIFVGVIWNILDKLKIKF